MKSFQHVLLVFGAILSVSLSAWSQETSYLPGENIVPEIKPKSKSETPNSHGALEVRDTPIEFVEDQDKAKLKTSAAPSKMTPSTKKKTKKLRTKNSKE